MADYTSTWEPMVPKNAQPGELISEWSTIIRPEIPCATSVLSLSYSMVPSIVGAVGLILSLADNLW